MVFMIVFIPGIFPASYLVDTKSLRTGFILGAVLNAIGAIVRVLPWPFYDISDIAPYSFIPVAVGQTITAMAQTFILGLPPKLAQVIILPFLFPSFHATKMRFFTIELVRRKRTCHCYCDWGVSKPIGHRCWFLFVPFCCS